MYISFIAFFVVIIDFLTKRVVIAKVMPYEKINILPFLRIVYIENKGAAFGIFSNLGNNVFIAISLIAIIGIIVYAVRFAKGLEIYSFSLILGGALGNLNDRIMLGKVIDFIDVFVGKWHWPAFNVADSALTIGIALFIMSNIRHGKAKKQDT
ncbi:MAG: signal peptidase II [Nitrospirae bacterium]|nr:signal peptidase II [Nitrospirota bacterium]